MAPAAMVHGMVKILISSVMPRSVTLWDIGVSPRFDRSSEARGSPNRSCGEDLARGCQMLYARSNIYRLPEIILPLVQVYGNAGAFMNTNLQKKILSYRVHG